MREKCPTEMCYKNSQAPKNAEMTAGGRWRMSRYDPSPLKPIALCNGYNSQVDKIKNNEHMTVKWELIKAKQNVMRFG